jgi:methyl-accepting chemotaxis protein
MRERSQEQINNIMAIVDVQTDHANNYIIPFIKEQLEKVEDYLESAWLVNKFPDELSRIGDAMNRIRNSNINSHTAAEDLHHIIELIEYRIGRIDLYIYTIERERKVLGLTMSNEPQLGPKVE